MAISVATDLVLDVLKAGSKLAAEAIDDKLKATATSRVEIAAAGEKFAAEMAAAAPAVELPSNAVDLRQSLQGTSAEDTFQKFEAVILEQFVKYMLPQDSDVIFGEGTAGNIWKGMMAQQLGDAIVEGGGIGIAEQLARSTKTDILDQANKIIFNQELDVLDSLSQTSLTETE